MKRLTIFAVLVLLMVSVSGLRAARDGSLSAEPAAALKAQMEQQKMEAFAARDPDEPGRYVAVLYVPGIQFLVISAPYPAPALIDKKIAARQYMDVYVDMQAVGDRTGHFFVEDMAADGIRPESDSEQVGDTTTANGGKSTVFNGKWELQQLTQEEYTARLKRDDQRYARMLKVLSAALARGITVP
ncbi:MAG TPA: hypothetical protein VFK57_05795 [Vicinamibacterales bacterium]|nr:hypothetical protein [Vicinamibacterales bacterium]